MKRLLILILAIITLSFVVSKAEAKWWIFGQGNDGIDFDYLYLNNNSYEELGSKAVLYKDSLQNGTITIKGKTSIKKGKVGYVKITKDNKQTWEKAKVSDNGAFTYSFVPEESTKYQVFIEVADTIGDINKVDETYKEITIINESINGKVAEAVNNMIRAYENEESNLFMTYVSSDFTGDTAVLDSAIRKDFNAFELIKINPYINNISSGASGKAYVAIQFNRTVVSSKSGQTYTDKGYTEFVLTNENGKFKVFSMKNPLIFGLSDAGNVATGTVQSPNNDPILLVDRTGNVNEKPFNQAIDIIENDSDISDNIQTGSVTLNAAGGIGEGFIFSSETKAALGQANLYYQHATAIDLWNGGSGYNYIGTCSLNSVESVPSNGYNTGNSILPQDIVVGDCYAMHTSSYKYGVFKITGYVAGINGYLKLDYKYQPDGTRNF